MNDPQHEIFVKRLKRVERLNRRGGGFEAVGTLGRSHYTRSRRRSRSIWGPVIIAALAFLILKSLMVQQMGALAYEQRIADLKTGTTVEQVGAFVLQADPATVWLSEQINTWVAASQAQDEG